MNGEKSIFEATKVLSKKSNIFIKSKEELNKSIDHIVQLITDSYSLFKIGSYSTSLFLSIAIIEEVGKIHMGIYINQAQETIRNDLLRNHKTKQIIGSNYTISMGERLVKAIGKNNMEKIFELSYNGDLRDLREKALYCDRNNDVFFIPSDIINKEFSRQLLLFAIESFDDNLVGYSEYSIEKSKKADTIFDELSEK